MLGATAEELAGFFGVTRGTISNWIPTIPEFAAALREGRDLADAKIARGLFARAVGYSHSTGIRPTCDSIPGTPDRPKRSSESDFDSAEPAAGVRTRQRVAALKRRRPRVRRRSSRAWPPPIVHAWSPGGLPAASPAVARRFRIKSIVRHRAWRPGHRRRPRGAHRRPDRTTLRASSQATQRCTRNR
jgi:hypothetical protein